MKSSEILREAKTTFLASNYIDWVCTPKTKYICLAVGNFRETGDKRKISAICKLISRRLGKFDCLEEWLVESYSIPAMNHKAYLTRFRKPVMHGSTV